MPAKAANLDDAWSNFDPSTPLPSGSPFYVQRRGDPLSSLIRALIRRHDSPPKYFFSGHQGSGKSTELNRLVDHAAIRARYIPVVFSVRDLCDVNNLDYVDVLLAVGAQMFDQFRKRGGTLDPDLLRELEGWKSRTVEQLQSRGAVFEGGSGIDLSQFFLSALLKIKMEHSTRQVIRTVIEPGLSELVEKINLIATGIQASAKRQVLVLIDDLDKPSLDQARRLFYDAYAPLTQPTCAIVYTVPVAIFFSQAFVAIRESRFFLPNVKLHPQGWRDQRDEAGYATMREFVTKRMDDSLIEPAALNAAIRLSGGVFREMAHIMQIAADSAVEAGRPRIEREDVDLAESQIRSDFRRMLSEEDRALLREVRTSNEMRQPERLADLLHIRAVLEYLNHENWCDIHPALDRLVEEG